MKVYYAFQDKKSGKLITGTDYRYRGFRQLCETDCSPPILIPCSKSNSNPGLKRLSELILENAISKRNINLKRFRIIKVNVVEVIDIATIK